MKVKQPRLLPALAPIRADDALSFEALVTRYRCQCGNQVTTGIKLDAVTCIRCGSTMKAVKDVN